MELSILIVLILGIVGYVIYEIYFKKDINDRFSYLNNNIGSGINTNIELTRLVEADFVKFNEDIKDNFDKLSDKIISILDDKERMIELTETLESMQQEGNNLTEELAKLNNYYEMSSTLFRKLVSRYFIYKQNAVDTLLKDKWASDNPIVAHFVKETLGFDKDLLLLIDEYNNKSEEILNADK